MSSEEKTALDSLIKEIETEMETLVQKIYPELESSQQLDSLANDLRTGRKVSNIRFDRIYPSMIRKLSSVHWTPVDVALKASSLLVSEGVSKVLDVGSGCGKFCLIGAIVHSDVTFCGIEQRSYLSELSKTAARNFKLKNSTFLDGNMVAIDWSEYDAFYFFNPFYENRMLSSGRIDASVPANEYRFDFYLETVCSKLAQLKIGTRVVTYHGLGGDLPDSYELRYKVHCGTSELELWVKTK